MRKVHNANIVRLSDYISHHEVRPHPFYESFGMDMLNPPDVDSKILSHCCVRRPVVFAEQGKKRIVIDNCLCYMHARIALDRGYKDMQVWVREVKNAREEDIFLAVFLDSLGACPFMRIKPLFRLQILKFAYGKREFLKDIFDANSLGTFSQTFGVPPSTLTRDKKLETSERTRLAQGEYKGRGKSIQKQPESKEARQPDHTPQSSERPGKKNEHKKTDVKKQQDLF